jgi:hypothetical protein
LSVGGVERADEEFLVVFFDVKGSSLGRSSGNIGDIGQREYLTLGGISIA